MWKSTSTRPLSVAVAVLILITLILVPGCKKKRLPVEQEVVDNIAPYCTWVEDYRRDNMCYPDDWDTLLRWKGQPNPENPYTGEPMVALDSGEFDKDKSPGNFFYARVIRNDCVINFQVFIFGERGEIARYSHAGPMAVR